MNSAKKILNQQDEKKDKKISKKTSVSAKKSTRAPLFSGRNVKPVVLSVFCIIVLLVLCIGVGIQQGKPKVVVTIGDTEITMEDMMYPIYEVESEYLPYNELYETYYGTSIWEADYQTDDGTSTGVTNSVGLKSEILNSEVEYEILYQMAVEDEYELTDDEKEDAKEQAKEALEGLSWLQKVRLSISESNLTERFEKRILAERYRDDQQEELNKDVDEEAAIEEISKKDYRQYDIQYYYAETTTTDDDGNITELSKKKKKKLASKLEKIAKQAKNGKDFDSLLSDDEKSVTFVEEEGFTKQDGWSYVSNANLKKIKKLKNGEVSEAFLDDETGYYVVVKMVDNNSTEAYDEACDEAIAEAQDDAYQTWFDEIATDSGYTVNSDVWTDVTIGSVTTDIVTAEDLEAMSEDSSDETDGSSE